MPGLLDQDLSEEQDRALRLAMLNMTLQGQSGGYREQAPGALAYEPTMLNARLGLDADRFRAGVTQGVMKIPQMGYRAMPPMLDLGYRMPALGGLLDISGSSDLGRNGQAMVRYSREF